MKCIKCGLGTQFISKGPRVGWCKKCWQRARNENGREFRQNYYRKRRLEDPDYRKQQASYSRKCRKSEKGRRTTSEYKRRRRQSSAHAIDLAGQLKYYHKHREKRIRAADEWKRNNPDRAREHSRRSMRKRKSNPVIALADRMRHALRRTIKRSGNVKRGKTFDLLGYTPEALTSYLIGNFCGKPCVACGCVVITVEESHIDHIVPVVTAATEEDALRLNQLKNLRLICATCNQKKGPKVDLKEAA